MKKKYTAIRKQTDNPYLNLYEIDALSYSDKPFKYYFASRNDEENIKHRTKSLMSEGIVIYPVWKDAPDKLVMIKQYRYPIDEWIYELPAGLIDKGETAEEAAVREMKEETGLEFEVYEGGDIAFRRPFFLGAGFTDEMSTSVYGYASGEISKSGQEDTEQIEVILVDKTEARRILSTERVSLRAGLLLMEFIHSDIENPFLFLN